MDLNTATAHTYGIKPPYRIKRHFTRQNLMRVESHLIMSLLQVKIMYMKDNLEIVDLIKDYLGKENTYINANRGFDV